MLLLAYRNLRTRPARTLFTALAIALGVGMIFAMRIVGVTIEQSAREARESRLAGADMEVTSAAGAKFPEDVADVIAGLPQVELAAPLYRGLEGAPDPNAREIAGLGLKGTGLALLGVDPVRTLSRYDLAAGAFFSTPGAAEVLLPGQWAALNGLGVGSKVTLVTGPQTREYTVAGLLKTENMPGSAPTAWLPLKTIQSGFETPGVATAVLVRLKSNVNKDNARDELQAALGTQFIVTSATGGAGLSSLFGLTNLALPFSGFVILLAGAFLVFNAFAITLAERRREIGQLRTLGMTRGQVMAQTLAEAALIALFGSGIGLLLGWALGYGVTLVVRTLQGDGSVPNVPPPLDGVLLALGAGLLITLAVTFNLARAAAQVSPLEALQTEQRTARSTAYLDWALGGLVALLLTITVALGAWAERFSAASLEPSYGPIFLPMFMFALAMLCLLPLWVSGVIRLWKWIAASRLFRSGGLLSGAGVAAQLAAGSLDRQRTRAALTAVTLTLGLMIVIALAGITFLFRDFLISANQSLVEADYVFTRPFPPGTSFEEFSRLPSLPPIPDDLQAGLDALADIADVSYFANVSLPGLGVETGMGDQYSFAMDLRKVRDNPFFPVTEGSWDEAEPLFAAGPAIMLPELTARRLNKHPGDTLEVDTLHGKVPFTVALVGGGYPIVTIETAQRYFGSYPFAIQIDARPGADKAELQRRVEAMQEQHGPALAAVSPDALQKVVDSLAGPIVGLFAGLTSLSGIVAALGIVVTLFASVLERQREFGTLRAVGMSRAHVRGVIVLEAGLLGLAGASLGASAGLGMAYIFGRLMLVAMASIANLSPIKEVPVPWAVAGVALLAGPAMAMLAALWPADRAASVNPAEAMRAEGATGFLKPAAHLGPTGFRGLILRMPLAAKLSFAIGVVFVLTLAALTAVRVNYERQLLEENLSALLARVLDASAASLKGQLSADVTELTPQMLAAMQQQSLLQAEAAQSEFLGGRSAYEFGLKYFFVTSAESKVIISDRPEFIGRTLTDTVTLPGSSSVVRLTDWTGERVYEAAMPIENKAGKRLGIIRLGLSTEPVDNITRDIVLNSLWAMLAALTIAVLLTVLLARRALAPVAQIAEASQAVARGDLTWRVPETHWDEVGRLARSFNDMVKGLNERQRLEHELRLARVIQQTLLPKEAPALAGWEMSAYYQPARQVGGDFYDFVPLPDGRLGIVVGDATDKGAPAALLMATARSLLRAAALDGASPGQVLARANDLLHPDIPPKMFVTCLYAVLDPASGRLQYANAGHPLPYRRNAEPGQVTELRARGMPLGLLPGMRYEEKETQLVPGESLLFYSDGLVEAHNRGREMLGLPRLGALIAGRPRGVTLIDFLLAELRRFTGAGWEQEDDVTLVTLERNR